VFVRLPEELNQDKVEVPAVNAKVRYFV
jgi:hypothetical protein